MKKDNKNIVLFLILAFLLPFLSVLMQSMIKNEILRFIMYGIQAASPSIAALILLCLNKESTSFFKNVFQKKHLVFVALPLLYTRWNTNSYLVISSELYYRKLHL